MPATVVNIILGWGWLAVVALMLWIAWKVYLYIKRIDYTNSVQWTILQITIPEESEETPKAMENAFDVWDGIHKSPDLIEKYFEGYVEAWYSCEIHCEKGRARYLMVVPTMHRTFFEGVIYGQYPQATIIEVEDYTLRYHWKDLEKTFDMYGTEIVLTKGDIMPIKTYKSYEDVLAEEDKFVDPHQALIEAYTNIDEGQEFWVQIVVRPIDPKLISKWEEHGEQEIDKIAGKEVGKNMGWLGQGWQGLLSLPAEIVRAAVEGPAEPGAGGKDKLRFPFTSETDKARMQGILDKISQGGYKTRIRVIHIAPMGQLHKPNISRAIGAFKQFNTFHLNSLAPSPETKTNGPNYILKAWRRYMRKRRILLYFQWRDLFSANEGDMMSAEELATLYHFPAKYMRAPAVERAKAGLGSAPDNVPYA